MSSTVRSVLRFRSLIAPLAAAVVTLALFTALLSWHSLVGGTESGGNVITSPDTAGSVGFHTSLALDGSGNPVVSYVGDGGLKVLHCGDPNCSSGNVITSPDTTGDHYTSLTLDSSGNPVVSYHDGTNRDLKVLHCGDPNCSSGNVITSPDSAGRVGRYTSLALDGSGNPVVSYYDGTNEDLKVLHCGDPNCSSGNVITSPDTSGFVGRFTSLVLDSGGKPVVSYRDDTNGDLSVLHCGDPNCSSGNVITSPDTVGDVGELTSLVLDGSGNPVVSYHDGTNRDLKVLHCGDPNCSSGNVITSPDTVGGRSSYPSLVLDSSGNPVVSYHLHPAGSLGDLKVLNCGDPNCTSGNVITSPDTAGDPGAYSSLALDVAGNPVVSYLWASERDLRVLHCGSATCGLSDISASGVVLDCPANADAGMAFTCTVDVTVHNNGPFSPVSTGGAVNVGVPSDCTVENYTFKGQGFGTLPLDVSVSQVVSKEFVITCTESGLHQIVGCAVVEIRDADVADPVPYNNFDSAQAFTEIDGTDLRTVGRCSVLDPPEVCGDGIDNDADTLVDEEPDTDGDGVSDCDDLDDDGDGFTDAAEESMGTDPLAACPAVQGVHPAWPPDFDDSQVVDIIDVLALKPVFGSPSVRHDLDASGGPIDIVDVLALKPVFNESCV